MKFFNLMYKFNLAELYTLIILTFYSILSLIFLGENHTFILNLIQNFLIVGFIAFIANIKYENIYFITFRKFYLLMFVYFIYNQTHTFIPYINSHLYDDILIKIDNFIFGCHPTHCTIKIANPILTEFLQFCYMTFFFMPIIHGIELHIRHKDREFYLLLRNILFGFYLSYLFYFLLPAVGPRFTLHDFNSLSQELPGLFLTDFFRSVVNAGGGIINNTLSPIIQVHRDCMPSGHTMMTLINIYLAFRFKSKLRYVFLFFGSGLIFATVYLRYHYVIDLIAGAFCFVISIILENYIANKFMKNKRV